MAQINQPDAKLGYKNGATWDTAEDLTSGGELVHYESFDPQASWDVLTVRGAGSSPADTKRTTESYAVSLSYEMGFHENWALLACLFGTAGAPTEQNSGEGDYLHNIDIKSNVDDIFTTLSKMIESDQVLEMPSVRWTNATMTFPVNGVPTVDLSGVASNRGYSGASGYTATNTASEVNALSLPTIEKALLGGANMYVRLKDYSTSVQLSSTHDQQVSSVVVTIARPFDEVRVTRAAASGRIIKPVQTDQTIMTVQIQYEAIDDSLHDPFSDADNQTDKMFELFMDGEQIGSGDNASIKLQIPRMKAINPPSPGDSRGSRLNSSITYQVKLPVTAAAGMSGLTELARVALTNERSTAYIS